MNPTSLVGLALLGLAPPALAADIDEIATTSIGDADEQAEIADAVRERSRVTRSNGKRTVTHATGTGPRGNTVHHVEATNGRRTVEGTRVATPHGVVRHREVTGPNGRSIEHNSVVHPTPGRPGRTIVHPSPGEPGRTVVHTTPAKPGRTVVHDPGRPGGPKVVTTPGAPGGPKVVHPTPGRPGATVVHPTPGRPGTTVVHTTPGRPGAVVVHRPGAARPPTATVVHGAPRPATVRHVRTVTYRHVHPYHGVFVYGPRPATHVTYVQGGGPVEVARADLPQRQVDRSDTLALGVMGGSMISSSPIGGELYGDPGLGLVGRYRPAEMVGLELGVMHHAASFSLDEKRTNTQVGGQLKLFAFPWARVSPYALGGVTFNASNVQSQISETETLQAIDGQWGLDGGLGVELALGNNFAIDLEGKYIGWLDERLAGEAPGAFQATAGMLFHFR